MTEPSTFQLIVGWLVMYDLVATPFKMFLVFLWKPEHFVLNDPHPSHDLMMAWISIICGFIMIPVIPEIFYLYILLFKRKAQ